MDIIRIGQKGNYLNTLEKYYIYKVIRTGLKMKDTNIDEHNPIFEELQKIKDVSTPHTIEPSLTDTVVNV
jgi:hypothetical protein